MSLVRRTALALLVPTLAAGALALPGPVPLPVRAALPGPDTERVRIAAMVRTASSPEVRTWDVPAAEAGAVVARLEGDRSVLAVGHDSTAYATAEASAAVLVDPRRAEQWALDRLDADAARSAGGVGTGLVVAVIDSGVDASHPDLAGSVLPGVDLVSPGGDGRVDPNGHGTHVAGVIAAHAGNGVGVAGLADGVKVLPVRVLDENGEGPDSGVARGVVWAVDHGADVINLSLGSTDDVAVLRASVEYARSRGVVVVAAMGNSALEGDPTIYPAAYPGVLAVAATSGGDMRGMFSSTGPHAGLAAPGVSILSTFPGGQYAHLSGTSMAAPYVAASAALVRQSHPRMSESQVVSRLRSAAQDLGREGHDPQFGAGMVDPFAARTDGVARPAPANPALPALPLPSLPLPKLPDASLPELPDASLPKLPDASLPKLPDASLPELPDASLPGLPGADLPALPAPRLPALPDASLPDQPSLPGRTQARMVLGVSVSTRSVPFGSKVVVSGNLGGFGTPHAGQVVEVLVKPDGAPRFTVASRSRTDASGRVAFSALPPKGTDFALRFPGTPGVPAVTSRSVHVDVSSSVTLSAARSGREVTLSGKVTPPRSGATVRLEQLQGTRWVLVSTGVTRPDGSFSFRRPRPRTTQVVRVSTPAAGGLVGASSNTASLTP